MVTASQPKTPRHRFLAGLVTGAAIGAGMGMLFAPRAAFGLRRRLGDSAERVGTIAADRYRQATDRAGAQGHELLDTGRELRDRAADSIVRGAQRVEQYAEETTSEASPNGPGA